MKIKPDFRNRNDGYDDDVIRYWEDLNEKEGYYYELYVLVGRKKARIIVTENGVSIDFKASGESIHTNIVPSRLFKTKKLEWEQLAKIVMILEKTGLEGMKYSKEEMEELFEKFRKDTEKEENA